MKVVPLTIAQRLYGTMGSTKTRITISQYDQDWVFESDTDVTSKLIKGVPNISMEIEKRLNEFTKDQVDIDFEDENKAIRNMFNTEEKNYLLKIEKGFIGAEWITIFDGIIDIYEAKAKGRNITSVTAYSMEMELEFHDASNSASSGLLNQPLATLVGHLWDLSYINIPGGNRTIDIFNATVPDADYGTMTAREVLDELAIIYGCVWKRTERNIASFVDRSSVQGTFNLDTNLYKDDCEHYWERGSNGVYLENSTVPVEQYSAGYSEGYNIKIDSTLTGAARPNDVCWAAEQVFSHIRYRQRVFHIPAFYILELEPIDRVNLTLRDRAGVLDETIITQLSGLEYDDVNKITELKLTERKPFLYERYNCDHNLGVFNVTLANWCAQTYTLGASSYNQNHNLVQTRLLLSRLIAGPPIANYIFEIRNTVAGQPGPVILGSVTIPISDIPVAYTWWETTFNIPQVVGTQYAMVSHCNNVPATDYVNVRIEGNAGVPSTYPGGVHWRSWDGGTTWNTAAFDEDELFECWGQIT